MLIGAFLAAARFVHYVALAAFFGAALFPLYAPRGADLKLRPLLVLPALAVVVSGVLWLGATAAQMAGEPSAAFDPSTLWTIISQMDFGRVWAARLVLALVAAMVAALAPRGRTAIAALAAVLLASVALTGHAQSEPGRLGLLHEAADAAHLLAAGAWLGGLLPLALILRRGMTAGLVDVLRRFSGMGYAAVAVLVATGLVNATLLVGSLGALVSTPYGRLLTLKLTLFAAMLVLAAANRFWIMPRLTAGGAAPGAAARQLRHLRGHVLAEQLLGLGVLAVVAVLGSQPPSVSL